MLHDFDLPPGLVNGTGGAIACINSIGFRLYGKSDYDAGTDSYMATYYFVALYLPLFPLARYRVIREDRITYRFLGKGKFRQLDRLHVALFAGLLTFMIAAAGLDWPELVSRDTE